MWAKNIEVQKKLEHKSLQPMQEKTNRLMKNKKCWLYKIVINLKKQFTIFDWYFQVIL